MKKIILLLFIIFAFQSKRLQAQVYKRITGIDSIGYSSGYSPYLHSGFRFTYPNNTVGNGDEVRSLYVYHLFPYNTYRDCYFYNLFQFSAMEDTMGGYDTTHYFSRTGNALVINNKEKVISSNGLPSAYYDGTDTLSHFYYNGNGQITSEVYKRTNKYGIKQSTYQYNSQNQLSGTYTEDNFPNYFYSIYKYNSSGILIERTDSSILNDNTNGTTYVTYIIRYRFKQVGSVTIVNTDYGSNNYDDSMYYNSYGKLDRIKSSYIPYGTNVFYYYDSSNYLDSVVYKRQYQTDKVVLYWETYTPGSSGINPITKNTDQMAIFPNPSTGSLNIRLELPGGTMTMTNALGQTVGKVRLNKGINTIDVSHLAKGIYFIQLDELNECKQIVIE